MQKNTLLILLLSVAFHFSNAQSSVAIGSNTPNPKAVLWLNAQGGQGLLLPSLNTASRTSMGLNNTTEKGMMVYDNQLDQIFFWNGAIWVEAVGSGSVEVDGIVGNEVTKVTTDRGLSLTGSGTAVSPFSVGLIDGTADQQVLKWNNVTKKWELGTDAGSAFIAGAGIQITGTTLTNTGDTDATNDITTSSLAAGDVTGPFSNLQIGSTTVTSAELASNAVTTLKIADDAVTLAKIGTAGVTDALKVLTTDASGNPQWSSSGATGDMLKTVYDPSSTNANAFDLNNHTGDIATTQIENSAVTPVKIAGAGASARGILGSDNNTVSWVTGTPSQLLGTDATGAFQFTDKSNFIFTTPNVIPKGSVTGLVSSQLFDDGTNVGIGNATPAYKLDVFGTALIRPVIIGSAAYLGTSWFSLQHQQLPLNNISYAFAQHKGGYTLINTPSNAGLNFIDFRVDDVSKMRMLENGNVGIGTTTPLYPLDIQTPLGVSTYGLNHTDGDIIMSTYVGNGGVIGGSIGTQSNHPFFIYTNNSGAKLTVLPTGDIGIGTTAPTAKLEVNGYTKLGSSAPAIQTALLTGTTASTEGGLTNLSFAGITTRDKIISITVMVDWSGSGSDWIQPNWVNSSGFYFNWLVNSTTNLAVVNQLNNTAVPPQRSNAILNKAVRAFITYIP